MRDLLRYSFMLYMDKCHYLPTLVLIVLYFSLLYVLIPLFELCGFSTSVTILFAIALVDGFSAYKVCSNDIRAIMALKSGSGLKYYVSNELLLVILSMGYTILVFICPCAVSFIHMNRLDPCTAAELTALILLHLLVAFCGYQLGSLFQPHMIGKRIPVAVLFLVTVLGMILGYKLSMVPVVRHLFWIFPPIVKILHLLCTREGNFYTEIGYSALQLALYTFLLLVGKGFVLSRRGWAVYE